MTLVSLEYSLLKDMTFRSLQLLFPFLVALHNAEEAIGMPRWTRRAGPWFGGVQPAVFQFAAVVLTVLALAVTVLSAAAGRLSFWADLTFGYMVAMLLNALVPHIAVSIASRTRMPGVVTAAALNLPILSFLTFLALKQGYVAPRAALEFAIAVPLLLLAMIPLLFKLGKLLEL
jgi:hypothetical protein